MGIWGGEISPMTSSQLAQRHVFKDAQSSISYDVKNWKNIGGKAWNDRSPYDQVI